MERGSYLATRYNLPGPVVWHQRLVVAISRTPGSSWRCIATPDGDVYMEWYSLANPDIAEFRFMNGRNGAVVGVANRLVYRFAADPSAAELAVLFAQGDVEMALHDGALPGVVAGAPPAVPAAAGAPPPAAAPAVAGPVLGFDVGEAVPHGAGVGGAGAGAAGGLGAVRPKFVPLGGAYVLDEPTADYDVGDLFVLPAGVVRVGNKALALIGGQPVSFVWLAAGTNLDEYARARGDFLSVDRRLLPSRRPGDPTPTFASLVNLMEVSVDPGGPSPLLGPSTMEWFMQNVAIHGTDLVARHHRWVAESSVKPGIAAVHEHQILSMFLQHAVITDRLNIKNLTCCELALRRLQLHESAVAECPENPSYEGSRHFLGIAERKGGALIAPSLSGYVAAELGKEAAILKEKRKSRENRSGGGGRPPKAAGGAPGAK
jgi:hypothetical protein